MSSQNDGSGKGPAKPGTEGAAPKKPAAIIDLKANEVEVKPAAPGAQKTGTAVPPIGSPAKAATTGTTTSSATPSMTTAGASSSSTASKPTGTTAASAKSDPATVVPKPAPAAPAPARGGFVGMLTHLTAGVAGGLLALLAADTVGPKLGLPVHESMQQSTNALQQRLTALEADLKSRPTTPAGQAEAGAKLAAAERRIAELEKSGSELPTLRDTQAKLVAQSRSMEERLAKAAETATSADGARLAKLEETLAALSSAAGTDPQKGRIPQLATITGKLADLESSLSTQVAAIRKGVTQEVDARLTSSAEASEAAKQGTQRIDRELATVKSEAARLAQRLDVVKTGTDQIAETLKTVAAETAAVKSDVASQLKTVARPQDVTTALAPVTTKLTALETSVQGVLKAEDDRKANAERVVLSLELGNLKRALDRGGSFASELAAVQNVAGTAVDLKVLDKFKTSGVPTIADLGREFRQTAYAIIDADKLSAEASVVDKLITGAQSIVRVRKTDVAANDTTAEAVVARMEGALKAGQLATTLAEAKKLSSKSASVASSWLDKVQARHAADGALAAIDDQLKASLSGKPATKGAQ